MTETGLIAAQVAFLLLLYLFVWSVVRSGGKQVEQGPPPRPPADDPAPAPRARATVPAAPPAPAPTPQMAMAAPPAPPAAPAPAAPGGGLPAADPEDGGGTAPTESGALRRARERSEGMGFDMASNLHPRLVVERSPTLPVGSEIDLRGGMTIGRSEGSGIRIADSFVSHMHARIMRRGAYYYVEDLGSTNGTYLNDRRIDHDAQLKVHDELRLGETLLRYEE